MDSVEKRLQFMEEEVAKLKNTIEQLYKKINQHDLFNDYHLLKDTDKLVNDLLTGSIGKYADTDLVELFIDYSKNESHMNFILEKVIDKYWKEESDFNENIYDYAIEHNYKLLKILIKYDFPQTPMTSTGYTTLLISSIGNDCDFDTIKLIAESYKNKRNKPKEHSYQSYQYNINFCTAWNQTALSIAIFKNNFKLVELLINNGANVNDKCIDDKLNSLELAIKKKCSNDIIELLRKEINLS